jgi:hypothetical protein
VNLAVSSFGFSLYVGAGDQLIDPVYNVLARAFVKGENPEFFPEMAGNELRERYEEN